MFLILRFLILRFLSCARVLKARAPERPNLTSSANAISGFDGRASAIAPLGRVRTDFPVGPRVFSRLRGSPHPPFSPP